MNDAWFPNFFVEISFDIDEYFNEEIVVSWQRLKQKVFQEQTDVSRRIDLSQLKEGYCCFLQREIISFIYFKICPGFIIFPLYQ